MNFLASIRKPDYTLSMTVKESNPKNLKNWPAPVKAAVDAANKAAGVTTSGPGALVELLGIARAAVYQWETEVPTAHALTLWRDLDLHPSVTCPSVYPKKLFDGDTS